MPQDVMGTCSGSYSRQIPRRMGRTHRPLRRLLDSSTSTRCISPRFPVLGSSFLSPLKITRTVWSHACCPSLNEERMFAEYVAIRMHAEINHSKNGLLWAFVAMPVRSRVCEFAYWNNIPEGAVAIHRPKHNVRYPLRSRCHVLLALSRSPGTVTCERPESRT